MKKRMNLIIILIGLVLMVLGYVEYDKYNKEKNSYGVVEATVNEVKINGDSTTVVFEYYLNEKYYFGNVNTSTEFQVGNKQKIYYLKNNPEVCKVELMDLDRTFLFFIAGVAVVILGIVLSIKKALVKNRIKRLKKKGLLVKASIQEVLVINKNRGRNPYQIRACYYNPQENKTYYFVSEEDETDLKEIVTRKNLTAIDVYINSKDTNDYYVDIESIKA